MENKMAKIKTNVYLESVKTTVDGKNWIDGNEHLFEITPVEQQDGMEACVTIGDGTLGKGATFTLKEMKALVQAMETTDRGLNE